MKIKLFHYDVSGNSYKVKLLLSFSDVKYEIVIVNLMKGEHKSPEFLKLNPFEQVPVLIGEDIVLQDSQAILVYLARKYGDKNWLPKDRESLRRIVCWLSINVGEISQSVDAARLFYLLNRKNIDIEVATQKSTFILEEIKQYLTEREWLELNISAINHIAFLPYIVLAPNGKIALDSYSHIPAWIDRIKQIPGFVDMHGI